MEIKEEEFILLNEAFTILQQVEVKGANVHLMSNSLSRIQSALQSMADRKQKEDKIKKEVKK
jgi:hypothetical protein